MRKGIIFCSIIAITTLLSGCMSKTEPPDTSLDSEIIFIASMPTGKPGGSENISTTPRPIIKPVIKETAGDINYKVNTKEYEMDFYQN